jgi:hypothetical protein
MKNSTLENRMILARNRFKISDEKLSMGSTRDKFPVVLDGGKTVIYVSDKNKVEETRLKYEMLRKSRLTTYNESFIS